MVCMRLADYIVSYSLQINNRCLRFLAESHARGMPVAPDGGLAESAQVQLEVQPVYAESALVRDSRRLQTMWAWMGVEGERVAAHRQELAAVVHELTENVAPTQLALRLASQAIGEEDATNLLRLARAIEPHEGVSWMRLNELFAEDSDLWRDVSNFTAVDDEQLLARVCFNYRKGYKMDGKLPRNWPAELPDPKLEKVLLRQKNYCQDNLHQLELLRPGLSEKGKRQLWYLDKLADAHRMLSGLARLQQLIDELIGQPTLRKPVGKAARAYIDGQIDKIYKRVERLSPNAYEQRPKRFRHGVQHSLLTLGLETVYALKGDAGDAGAAAEGKEAEGKEAEGKAAEDEAHTETRS